MVRRAAIFPLLLTNDPRGAMFASGSIVGSPNASQTAINEPFGHCHQGEASYGLPTRSFNNDSKK